MMYLSVKEAKTFGLIQEAEVLAPLIELYSRLVEEYCRTKFLPAQATVKADVDKRIYFQNTPLLQVAEALYLDCPIAEDVDYYVYPELDQMMLEDPERYEKRRKSLTITYLYGFEQVPALVKKVIAELIRLDMGNSEADGTVKDPTIISENFDGEYSYQKNGSKTVEDMRRDLLSLLDCFVQKDYISKLSRTRETGMVRARLL